MIVRETSSVLTFSFCRSYPDLQYLSDNLMTWTRNPNVYYLGHVKPLCDEDDDDDDHLAWQVVLTLKKSMAMRSLSSSSSSSSWRHTWRKSWGRCWLSDTAGSRARRRRVSRHVAGRDSATSTQLARPAEDAFDTPLTKPISDGQYDDVCMDWSVLRRSRRVGVAYCTLS